MNDHATGLRTTHEQWRVSRLEYFFGSDTNPSATLSRDLDSDLESGIDELTAIKIAEKYGLHILAIDGDWMALCNRRFPSIVTQNNSHYVLILRADMEKFLIHDPRQNRTSIISTFQFLSDWSGKALVFSKKDSTDE